MNVALLSLSLNTSNASAALLSVENALSGGSNLGAADVQRVVSLVNQINQGWSSSNVDPLQAANNSASLVKVLMNIPPSSLAVASVITTSPSQNGICDTTVALNNWSISIPFDDSAASLCISALDSLLAFTGLQDITITNSQLLGSTIVIQYQVLTFEFMGKGRERLFD